MRISSILIMALATGILPAQEAAHLDGRFQVFVETYRPAQIVVDTNGDRDQPTRQTSGGFRFMGELASARGFYYELGGMFDGSSNLTLNLTGVTNVQDIRVTDSYWSVGGAYMTNVGANGTVGIHLEGRGEYLRAEGQAVLGGTSYTVDAATTYLRPWLRGSADYTFSKVGADIHPFVGVDAALALIKTSQTSNPDLSTGMDNRTLCALAPKASAAIYAGLRF